MRTARFLLAAALAALATARPASAHLGYGGRNFGPLVSGAPAISITNQTFAGGFGWADATDADQGDSHRGRFFRFTLTETTTVSITVARNANPLATGAPDTFLPAISLYAGLGQLAPEAAGHDSAALSISSRTLGTEGSFRALADWFIGNDPTYNTPGDPSSGVLYAARLAHFAYLGHVADGTSANYGDAFAIQGDGLADGLITGTFYELPAGDYSFFVGGADYDAQLTETGTLPTYGATVSIQALQAIPEPASFATLIGLATLTTIAVRRRKR
ncbi:MAG: PEP-CTERM sorting domain-containing protein [Burkholderiales bacterium]|nr:PEP-CTERM sorting domain-containing protein [Opitutaceae bacterium]